MTDDVPMDADKLDPNELVQEWYENPTPPKQLAHEYLWTTAHNLAAALRDTLAENKRLRAELDLVGRGLVSMSTYVKEPRDGHE